MRWIKENKLIAIIAAIIIAVLLLFVVSVATGGDNVFFRSVNSVSSKLINPFSKAEESVRELVKKSDPESLIEENEKLKRENAELRKQLAEQSLTMDELSELKELAGILNYNFTNKSFDLVSCSITSFNGSNWSNVFTVDRGTESDIEVGDAVVNGMGLVGRIAETGDGWSKVVSITDEKSDVSFKLSRSGKQLGVVHMDPDGVMRGYMMDVNSTVGEGDVIITSGLGLFPEGIEIGSIKSVLYNSNTLLKEVEVEPIVDFMELDKVAVIK